MQNPFFWLLLSFLLVAITLTAVLAAAFPAFLEMGRVARSAEKLLDTLNRELPRTLESLRKTGGELSELGDELEAGIKSAKNIIKHTEHGIQNTQQQLKKAHRNSRSVWAGFKTAWHVLRNPRRKSSSKLPRHNKKRR